MQPGEIGDVIRRIPLFQGFDAEQIDRIREIVGERTFQAGEHLFKEGDPSAEILVILSGNLRVQTSTGSEIASIGKMELVGEMGVLTGHPRSADVVATQPSTALSIGRDDLLCLIESDKDAGLKIYRNVTHILCQRLRDNNIFLEHQFLILEDLTGTGRDA